MSIAVDRKQGKEMESVEHFCRSVCVDVGQRLLTLLQSCTIVVTKYWKSKLDKISTLLMKKIETSNVTITFPYLFDRGEKIK